MPAPRSPRPFAVLLLGLAAGIVALGAAVLWGHVFERAHLVQVHPNLAPMHFNAALALVLTGFALAAVGLGWRIGTWLGATLLLLGTAVFLQDVTGWSLGLDELLWQSSFQHDTTAPGRMAPNTSMAFALLGAALVVLRRHTYIGSALGVLALTFGLVALAGYGLSIDQAFAWKGMTPMAPHTALGVVVAGSALLLLGYAWDGRSLLPGLWFLSLCMGSLVGATGLLFWQNLDAREMQRIDELTQDAARGAAEEARRRLLAPVTALEALGQQAHRQGWVSPTQWALDAGLIGSLPGLVGVEWIDASFQGRLIAPTGDSSQRLATSVVSEARRRYALEWARTHRQSVVIGPLPFSDGGSALLVVSPLLVGGQVEAFFGGVVDAAVAFEGISDSLARKFAVEVRCEGVEVYRGRHVPSEAGARSATAGLRMEGPVSWELVAEPSSELLAELGTPLPEVTLVAALVTGLLLAVALRSGGVAALRARRFEEAVDRRTAELEAATLSLRFENAERRRSEDALARTGAVSRLLSGELERDRLLQTVTDAATELTGAGFGAFFHFDGGETLQLHTLSGVPRQTFSGLPVPRNSELFGPTFRGEGVVRCADVTADPRYGQNPPHNGLPEGHPRVTSYLAVPVVSRSGTVRGGLVFGHPEPDRFGERESTVAVSLAAQAAIALDNADLYEAETQAREMSQVANALKERFIATMGHELRNPLASIGTALAMLEEEPDPATGAEMRGILDRQVRQLTRLVEDLLDESRISSGKLQIRPEPIDLVAFAQATADAERGRLEGAKLTLELDVPDEPLWVEADPVRLSQVLQNLLGNAAKFTPAGGEISLGVRQEKGGEAALVTVSDTGCGVEPEEAERIFAPYAQVGGAGSAGAGLGLGLSIARALVEAHGGSLGLHSEGRGRGAEFRVSLPAAAQPPARPPVAAPLPVSSPVRRVLVIDDHPDCADSLAALLRRRGHEVGIAYSGEDGLREARRLEPQVVLCDLGLPDLDGCEVAARLRADPPSESLRMYAITGYADEATARRAIAAGFDGHMSKPVDQRRLRQLLGDD